MFRRAPDNEKGRQWKAPRLVAELWHCGDDYCDCTQPQVDLVAPNMTTGYPWLRRKTLWRGTFHSEAFGDELRAQVEELWMACETYGIPPMFGEVGSDFLGGIRPLAEQERDMG